MVGGFQPALEPSLKTGLLNLSATGLAGVRVLIVGSPPSCGVIMLCVRELRCLSTSGMELEMEAQDLPTMLLVGGHMTAGASVWAPRASKPGHAGLVR